MFNTLNAMVLAVDAAEGAMACEVFAMKLPSLALAAVMTLALAIFAAPGWAAQEAPTPRDAWWYLEYQVSLGPRNPGSDGHRRLIRFLQEELGRLADRVLVQDFTYFHDGAAIPMRNVAGLFLPGPTADAAEAQTDTATAVAAAAARTSSQPTALPSAPYMLIGAHFDTRPMADWDPDPLKRSMPITGANDGGSGVAVLLELAGVLATRRPPFPVMLAFFDGEDFGTSTSTMFLGSRQFAAAINPADVMCMILLDMVGDADLTIYEEGYSVSRHPDLVSAIWEGAAALGHASVFRENVRHYVVDDHIPFMERGIPSIDIIDFDYPYWHTTADTIDKCSPDSLRIVRDVIIEAIFGGRVAALYAPR